MANEDGRQSTLSRAARRPNRFGWVAVAFAAWIVGGFFLVLWAITQDQVRDVAASPYHLPVYAGFGTLALFCAVRLVRAMRGGRGWRAWRDTLPAGYGFLGLGAVVILVALVLDVGWRQGVGIGPGIEEAFAPSRVVLAIGLVLVAAAPLRAALQLGSERVPRLALLISTALLLGVLAWPGSFHPAANPWSERAPNLAGDNGEIWVMDADGSHQTRLIEASGDVNLGYASWAPDGHSIGYTHFSVTGDDMGSARAAIWLSDAAGSDPHVVSEGSDLRWIPRLSPDGAWVVFTREAQGGPWMDAGPVGPGQAGAQGGGAGPLSIPLPNADIWRVRSDGTGSLEQLTDSAGDDRAPVYSPDGSRILLDSTRDGNTEIYVIEADGSNPRRLTDDPGEDWGASWSPDGTQVSFNSDRTGWMEIYVMDADGSHVRQVTHDRGADTSPSWSPDGTRLAFVSRSDLDRGQIVSVAIDGSDRRDLSRSPSSDDQVWTGGWGPDGRIVFSRAVAGPAMLDSVAREDLGVASLLISAALLAAVVALLALTAPPFGSLTLVMTLATALAATPFEEWRFVPGGLAVGLALDIALWRSPARLRSRVAGAVAGGGLVLATGGVVIATRGLGWTPSLLLGVAVASGAVGWAIGALVASPQAESRPGAAGPAATSAG